MPKLSVATLCYTWRIKRGLRTVFVQTAARLAVPCCGKLNHMRNCAALPRTYPANATTQAAVEMWRCKRGK